MAAERERPWRCFVAVPISSDLRSALAGFVADLRRRPAQSEGWRWTDPGGWHVTLAFVGATDASAVTELGRALTEVAVRHPPFDLASDGLGAFPSRGRARVLWYGIADPDGLLGSLARSARRAVGLEPEERFRGHLTLARARDRRGTDASGLVSTAAPPAGEIAVDRLVLYRSHLGRGPAHYEELASAPLGGGPA